MSQHGRAAGSHPDEPPTKRRTLQIKLGRPRPTSVLQQTEQASPSLNRGLRISLKRKSSVAGSQATPPRFLSHHHEDAEESDGEDQDEDEDDEQLVDADAASEQDEDEDGNDDTANADEDEGDGDEEEEEDEGEGEEDEVDDDGNGEEQHSETARANGTAGKTSAEADSSHPRIRGKNGAFQPSASSSNPSRRPIKRLRSKGLYEALPKLIENLQRRDSYKFFCEPVNSDDVPGYLDVIDSPMDFGTMQRKVDDRIYSHMDEFKADFQLVVSNAQKFNPEGTLYYNEAKRIAAWGNRAIEREGMAVNDNGRAGVKGDEIKRQKRLAREAGAALSAAPNGYKDTSPLVEGPGRRPVRGAALQAQQPLDEAGLQHNSGQTPLSYEATTGESAARPAARGSRFAFSAGVEALMEAARVPSQARHRAAIALGLTGGTLTREDSVQPGDGFKAEGGADMDLDDDEDLEASDEEGVRAGVIHDRESRERSATADGPSASASRRFGSSQPGGTPSTPMGQRQPSPDALRKRLAAVTGTPIQALASPMSTSVGGGGTSRSSKHAKQKQRLGAPGTPKRLLARAGLAGSATPIAGAGSVNGSANEASLALDPAAATAAAAQLMANVSQTQLQPGVANFSFDDDGSINPDDIDDLHTFLTLHRSGKHILMPTIESLHPIPFIPGDYSGSGAGEKDKDKDHDKDKERPKEKEKPKDKGAAADDGDDDDEDGKGESREKGDKDPLSTLPPIRPGAPDPLYSAIAPEPESYLSNLSHNVDPLPLHFRNLPFHTPSLPTRRQANLPSEAKTTTSLAQQDGMLSVPHSWSNPAWEEALKNDKRPKKQKDKEREKERETLEDWSYFRPVLTRLLEVTDLGPFSALLPQVEGNGAPASAIKTASKGRAGKGGKAAKQAEARPSQTVEFSTTLLGEEGIEAIKAELRQKRNGLLLPKELLNRYIRAARDGDKRKPGRILAEVEKQDASRIISDMVYGGVAGSAYIRSMAEFVGGAMHHAMLLDEADEVDELRLAEAEQRLLQAAAQRKAEDVEETPEPTAASRRGPFMWRDTTEEVGGTATPSARTDGEADQQEAHTTAVATPAEAEQGKTALHSPVEVAVPLVEELAPLPKLLAQVVEEEVIRPITGNTLDILHLVAVYLREQGCEALSVDEIEARLLHEKITPHPLEGVDASLLKATAPARPAFAPQASLLPPPPPIPFTAELDWLKDQPELARLLDEARQDVDSLGSILNYIIQSA